MEAELRGLMTRMHDNKQKDRGLVLRIWEEESNRHKASIRNPNIMVQAAADFPRMVL
jgi:hypothetical protein